MKKSIILLSLASSLAHAGGFEKVTMWSAKWSSLAGAAAAGTEGAESIYFNPAGLVYGNSGEVSLNFSSTGSKFSGPVNKSNTSVNSDSQVSPIGGAVGSVRLNDKISLGFGAYVAGGNNSYFPEVNYGNIDSDFSGFNADTQSKIGMVELSVGAGVKATKNLSFGAAWRASFAKAAFASGQALNFGGGILKAAAAQKFEDLEDQNFDGFRVGMQYRSDDRTWGFGATFRSQVEIAAEGDATGQFQIASIRNPALPIPGTSIEQLQPGKVTLETNFPYQVSVGGFFEPHRHWRVNAEVTHTDYSSNKNVRLTGNALSSNQALSLASRGELLKLAGVMQKMQQVMTNSQMSDELRNKTLAALNQQAAVFKAKSEQLQAAADAGQRVETLKDIELGWKDQQNYKVGIQYFGIPRWELRTGYSLTTQVTDSANARATFSTPGNAHTVVLGAGSTALKGKLAYDFGAEYSFAKADNVGTSAATQGTFTTDAYVLHTSVKFNF